MTLTEVPCGFESILRGVMIEDRPLDRAAVRSAIHHEKVIEDHNGSIKVDSTPEVGTAFPIRLALLNN